MALVESCCESIEDVLVSQEAGVDRIELCSELSTGGLTPSPELIRRACVVFSGAVMVLVRPRIGDFVYTSSEMALTIRQISESLDAGAAGVVVGCLDGDGRVAGGQLNALVAAAEGTPVTFHKAFDEAADLKSAYRECAEAGVARILTSGGRATALEGIETLTALVAMPGPTILAGGGVRAEHVRTLIEQTGVSEVHARASAIPELMQALA